MSILKRLEPISYAVGREKIREYARAVGEDDPVHLDLDAARTAGFNDVLAPPMFCVVYAADAINQALADDDLGLDLSRVLHGAQRFEWAAPVIAGDEIETTSSVQKPQERNAMRFVGIETESRNQAGDVVSRGIWTLIERGEEQ